MAQKKESREFTPKQLRMLLSVALALVFIGCVALFYLGNDSLKDLSKRVNQTSVDAEASEKKLQDLQSLKQQIAQSGSLISKANQMFAPVETYQSQVISDLQSYAQRNDISVGGTKFENDKNDPSKRIVSVDIEGSIPYAALVRFLDDIEKNTPKIQVASLTVERPSSGSNENVRVSNVTLSVSVR